MRGTILAGIAAFAIASSMPALAWDDMERMTFSQSLGQVLGSEEACGLSYDQAAIADLIARTVPADDMEFTSALALMTRGAEREVAGMSQSSRTAHCAQVTRVAASYGLTS